VAAGITGFLGLRMGLDIRVEYAAGFAFGLFIFQALFMQDMLGLRYGQAGRRPFLPEWLSMNAMMAEVLPTMVILMSRDMQAMAATSPWFWAAMSAATQVGVTTACPVNYWLVKYKLKHGMGTERALGNGGTPAAAARHDMAAMAGMMRMSPDQSGGSSCRARADGGYGYGPRRAGFGGPQGGRYAADAADAGGGLLVGGPLRQFVDAAGRGR